MSSRSRIKENEVEKQIPSVSSGIEVIKEAKHTLDAWRARLHAHGLSMYHA
jgi:hypothetical protein